MWKVVLGQADQIKKDPWVPKVKLTTDNLGFSTSFFPTSDLPDFVDGGSCGSTLPSPQPPFSIMAGEVANGRKKLPFFRRASPDRPIARRRQSTVHWHRTIRALFYLIAWIFTLLVVIGNVSNKPVLRDTYFLYLDLSNIIPLSVPNAVLINSIAQSIGLHDFYQVGLWNFCEGYDGQGITRCSKPKTLYAFNPVKIILNELLSGASSKFSLYLW